MTLPVGDRGGGSEFLNGAVLVETSRSPRELLALLQQIESQFGRERRERWSDRTLDLDLLLYGEVVTDTPSLTLPHPRMSFRRFVLEPAVEIAPEMVLPTIGWTLERLLAHLDEGADDAALVVHDSDIFDDLVFSLLSQIGFEVYGGTGWNDERWPGPITPWLRAANSPRSSREPKLTIVVGKELPPVLGRGPTLSVPAADGQDMATDIFAAIEAVWPRLGPPGGERLQ